VLSEGSIMSQGPTGLRPITLSGAKKSGAELYCNSRWQPLNKSPELVRCLLKTEQMCQLTHVRATPL
jgi:hypothetical protein